MAYAALDDRTARAELWAGETRVAAFTMEPHAITLEGSCTLVFDRLPVLRRVEGRRLSWSIEASSMGSGWPGGGSGRLDPKV